MKGVIMTLGYHGEALIKHFESCSLKAYQDSKGVWTIGWGNTRYENGAFVKPNDVIPQWRADQLFGRISQRFVNDVYHLTKSVYLKQCQFDALVSFAYNVGSDIDADDKAEGLGDSTLLKRILKNPDDPAISEEFQKWNKSGGKVEPGLIRRRQAEAHLYFVGDLKFYF
ncbi:MAG TPA: lysozyme [Niastella sp.]